MKYEITQTITQTITKVVDVENREEALALIEDKKFREELEVQRMEEWETDEEWEVELIRENPAERIYHARKCDISGEGMDEGYIIDDGFMYIKYKKDMMKHLYDIFKSEYPDTDISTISEEYLENKYCTEEDYYYWTEWHEEDDIDYVEVDGKVRLMTDADHKVKQFDELNK